MEQEINYFEILDNLNCIETCIEKTKTLKELRNETTKLLNYIHSNKILKEHYAFNYKKILKTIEDKEKLKNALFLIKAIFKKLKELNPVINFSHETKGVFEIFNESSLNAKNVVLPLSLPTLFYEFQKEQNMEYKDITPIHNGLYDLYKEMLIGKLRKYRFEFCKSLFNIAKESNYYFSNEIATSHFEYKYKPMSYKRFKFIHYKSAVYGVLFDLEKIIETIISETNMLKNISKEEIEVISEEEQRVIKLLKAHKKERLFEIYQIIKDAKKINAKIATKDIAKKCNISRGTISNDFDIIAGILGFENSPKASLEKLIEDFLEENLKN